MLKRAGLLLIAGILIVESRPVADQASLSATTGLTGHVKSAAGAAMEGVAVSARAEGKTFTTTVFTDGQGRYFFPPLDSGQYDVWAQAVGFEAPPAQSRVATGQTVQQNFVLTALKEFDTQLAADELLASMIEDGPHDKRMKAVLAHNCTVCHGSGFALQNKFDEAGWRLMVNLMGRTGGFGAPAERQNFPFFSAYAEELVEYLTRARGPRSAPLNYRLVPRPRGEAATAVITEFDLPSADRPGYDLTHSGSHWLLGSPSAYGGRAAHDAVLDHHGNVWFTDQPSPSRTIGRLDPRTGRVSNYLLQGANKTSVGTHGIAVDRDNNVWFTNVEEGTLTKFEPHTEKFVRYPRPEAMPRAGGIIEIDSRGNLWDTSGAGGAIKLDPRTGEYTHFAPVSPGGGPYGVAVDAEDRVWFTQIGADKIGFVDQKTGTVEEITLEPATDSFITAKDRELAAKIPSNAISSSLLVNGPRRMGADRNGDTVWVGLFWADKLLKIDTRTRKTTYYTVPHPYSNPYDIAVDKNHMVWLTYGNADRLTRFNPATEEFMDIQLPTRGSNVRFISIDDSTTPPTMWLPYYLTNKIARVQVRAPQGRATK